MREIHLCIYFKNDQNFNDEQKRYIKCKCENFSCGVNPRDKNIKIPVKDGYL